MLREQQTHSVGNHAALTGTQGASPVRSAGDTRGGRIKGGLRIGLQSGQPMPPDCDRSAAYER